MKKIASILLGLCILLVLTPSTAFAATAPKLIVDGVDMIAAPNHQIDCSGGGTATYDPATQTLTLNNATITKFSPGTINAGIYVDEFGNDFTVKLIGENKIHFKDKYLGIVKTMGSSALNLVAGSTDNGALDSLDIVGYAKKNTTESPFGIQNRGGDVHIGRIKLNISLAENSRPNGTAIDAQAGAISMDGTILNVEDYNSGLFAKTSLLCRNTNFTSSSAEDAIYSQGSAELYDCQITVYEATDYESIYVEENLSIYNSETDVHSAYGNAICCWGKLTISGGKLEAASDDEYPALFAGNELLIQNGAEITATAPHSNAISARQLMHVENGKVTATSGDGIYPIYVKRLDFSEESQKPTDHTALIQLGKDILLLSGDDVSTSDWKYDSDEETWYRKAYFNTNAASLTIDTAYIVTYAPGANGTGNASTVIKGKGAALTLQEALFTRDGYTQIGWALSENAATVDYALGAKYDADAATTLYPVWRDDHIHLEHIEAVLPTTEKEGNIEYWRCEECGTLFSDKEAKHEITLADTVTKKLTKEEPAGGNPTMPKTGDSCNWMVWIACLFVSGSAITATTVVGKRRNRH